MNPPLNQHDHCQSVLELKVHNHPGVMSHVCSLLARRAYNMEAIICLPMKDQRFSRIWLLVNEEQRLQQVIQQIQKLHDVIRVQRHGVDRRVFSHLEAVFSPATDGIPL